MSTSIASAVHLVTRTDKGLTCETPKSCVSWYRTGSASCASGYEHTTIDEPGFTRGSYCEQPCDDFETIQCASKKCDFYKGQCKNVPSSSI
jgi:hypothetical protein